MNSVMIVAGDSSKDPAAALGYRSRENQRDEAVSEEGTVETEWHDLFESINRHRNEGLNLWRNAAARISRERGLAYRMAEEENEDGWTLDPVPWIISPEKWTETEAGISQRCRLYEALLNDIYGPQTSLKTRLFPAEILLNHCGYLRALQNFPPGNGIIGLGLSGFDMAKDTGGQSFILNDRFDSPFGLGLALENRSVINKVLPRLFGRCNVRRIGHFFVDWFDYLARCSPGGSNAPQVVILDSSEQGVDSEIGFLSNYCSITRVTPSDLTVRDGQVWIKTLNGLVQVDVIWKAQPGRDMDSLESENSFARGTAGLFEAIRSGSVTVASHPGSGVLQSPGFYPYLPKLCRHFLGEDLLIPPVATWWCGEPKALSHVLENLATMVVKPVGDHSRSPTKYGSRLTVAELGELKAKISASPTEFVGQEELVISTVPTSRPAGLVPRGAVLRLFAFIDGEETTVMPGGLARVGSDDGTIISTRKNGESKDVWVRSNQREASPTFVSSLIHNRLVTPDIVPSRTGENLFWTGRYAERTDVISRIAARLIAEQNQGYTQDENFSQKHDKLLLKALFHIFGGLKVPKTIRTAEERLALILTDPTCPVGVPYNLDRLYNATQATREEWSPASILAINSCYEGWRSSSNGVDRIAMLDSKLGVLQLNLAAFLGLNLDSMTRDEGWALLDAGRRLERSSTVCGLLRFLLKSELGEEMNALFSESILYALDSVRTFQSRFHETPSTHLTMRLLLCEPDYPRSISHLLSRLSNVLEKLAIPENRPHPRELITPWIDRLQVFHTQLEEEQVRRNDSIQFLKEMQQFLKSLSDDITVSYFSHAKESS